MEKILLLPFLNIISQAQPFIDLFLFFLIIKLCCIFGLIFLPILIFVLTKKINSEIKNNNCENRNE